MNNSKYTELYNLVESVKDYEDKLRDASVVSNIPFKELIDEYENLKSRLPAFDGNIYPVFSKSNDLQDAKYSRILKLLGIYERFVDIIENEKYGQDQER